MKTTTKTGASEIVVTTEGQRLLREVAASNAAVAAAVGVSKAAVCHWRTGFKAPSGELRRKLEASFGVPVGSWDERAGGALPRPKASRAPTKPSTKAASTTSPTVLRGGRISTEEEAAERLAELQRLRSRPNLSIREVVQCIAAETAVLKVIREIQSDEEMTESRIVASEPHQRLVRSVLAALEPYPEALRAVVHAMEGKG